MLEMLTARVNIVGMSLFKKLIEERYKHHARRE